MGSFIMVMENVAIILIMIIVGFFLTKKSIITDRGSAEITALLSKFVTPCLIVHSFMTAGDNITPAQIAMAAGLAALAMIISIFLSYPFFRKEEESRKLVLRFCIIFGNAGFMGIPLVQGIVGDEGIVYGSFFIVVFNVIGWTYGYSMMGNGTKMNFKVLLLNPGVVGLVIGIPIYFLNIAVPNVILRPLGFFSSLNTPLAMIIIGSYIAKINFKSFITDLSVYKVSALRLIVCPAVFFGALLIIRPEPVLFSTMMIQAATPVAALAVIFSVLYDRDSALASKAIALSTVLSIFTIPVFAILSNIAIQHLY